MADLSLFLDSFFIQILQAKIWKKKNFITSVCFVYFPYIYIYYIYIYIYIYIYYHFESYVILLGYFLECSKKFNMASSMTEIFIS